MCVKLNDLPKDIQNQIAKIYEEIQANKKLWERRDAALRGLEEKYKTDDPIFGAMYMTPSGTLIDCSMFPNGHADVSAWLHEQGLEIDYQSGEASKLLYLKGWLRLNTKVGYIEEPHGVLTAQQRERLENVIHEGKFLWTEIQRWNNISRYGMSRARLRRRTIIGCDGENFCVCGFRASTGCL